MAGARALRAQDDAKKFKPEELAAIAWSVRYGETGVKTFIVGVSGDVYEQDLGPDTDRRAAEIALFDPGKGWEKADTTPP